MSSVKSDGGSPFEEDSPMKLGIIGIALGVALCSCEPPNGGAPQQSIVTFKGVPGSYVLTIPPGTVLTPTTDLTPYLTATTSGVTPQSYNRAKFDCAMIARTQRRSNPAGAIP
jgi:hypothetical protein